MKLFVSFSLWPPSPRTALHSSVIPKALFKDFVERWPEALNLGKSALCVREPADSPRLKDMFAFLEEKAGKVPNWKRFPAVYSDPGQFQLLGEREFDRKDLERAEYFVCRATKSLLSIGGATLDDGTIEAQRGDILRQPIGMNGRNLAVVLCTQSTRQRLEAAEFANLAFKPVKVVGRKPPEEDLWQLDGERAMPPVLNELVSPSGGPPGDDMPGYWDGKVFVGDRAKLQDVGCFTADLFCPPVLRFPRADVERDTGGFDVAPTSERWYDGPKNARHPHLICSRRFREFCMEQRWKLEWWPVELVD